MPASVWGCPQDRTERRARAQTWSHGAEAWRLSALYRAQGLHRHAPLRGLLVPVAILVDLRPTVCHGTTPWSPDHPLTMRGTLQAP
jgi:hypothetical protein